MCGGRLSCRDERLPSRRTPINGRAATKEDHPGETEASETKSTRKLQKRATGAPLRGVRTLRDHREEGCDEALGGVKALLSFLLSPMQSPQEAVAEGRSAYN